DCFFFFQAEDGIRDRNVTGVQTCALPICTGLPLSVPVGSPMVTEYEYVGSENTLLCGRSPGTSSPVRVASVGWQLSIPCPTSRLPNTFHITTRFVCCGHGRKGNPRDRGADTATSHIRTALVRAQRGQRLLRCPGSDRTRSRSRTGVQNPGRRRGRQPGGRRRA